MNAGDADPYPPIETERLVLRALRMSDAPAIERCCAPFEMAMMMLTVPHPYPPGAAEKFVSDQLEKARSGSADRIFAGTLKSSGELVATVGLRVDAPHRNAELGYWVAMEHWGKGYASEMAEALVQHGFATMELHRIHAGFYTHNPASGRVLEKAGFRPEGVRRQHLWRFDRFVDVALVGLLRSEWETMSASAGGTR